jgi:RIO kinase 1
LNTLPKSNSHNPQGNNIVNNDLNDELDIYANYEPEEEEDTYEIYESQFDPMNSDRQARRKRKPKAKHTPKKNQQAVIAEIAATSGLEGGFQTTYTPGPFEQGWLLQSLRDFYDLHLISDVIGRVKGGKEASVYRCTATPATGFDLLAAKVYRPRMMRNLRNDKMYREGRQILGSNGKVVKERDKRMMRALDKKTALGAQMEHTSWMMHEYMTLDRLFKAGAAVPQPIAVSSNAILMSYVGDENMGAHTLSEVSLSPEEAGPLFKEVMRNIELMLQFDLIHGDLSAYNILYWEGQITIIDFPQVTNVFSNTQARMILERDIYRVCEYFIEQGVPCNPEAIFREMWRRYAAMQAAEQQIMEAEIHLL